MRIIWKIGYGLVRNIRGGSFGSRMRVFILRKLGCGCSTTAYIGPNVTIIQPHRLRIGGNTSIHQDCYLDASGGVEIGDNVSIAHGVSIVSFNHTYRDAGIPIKNQPLSYGAITIKDNVWVGCRAVILAGAEIGSRSVVGALTLCNKAYDGNEILGGVPARVIKKI